MRLHLKGTLRCAGYLLKNVLILVAIFSLFVAASKALFILSCVGIGSIGYAPFLDSATFFGYTVFICGCSLPWLARRKFYFNIYVDYLILMAVCMIPTALLPLLIPTPNRFITIYTILIPCGLLNAYCQSYAIVSDATHSLKPNFIMALAKGGGFFVVCQLNWICFATAFSLANRENLTSDSTWQESLISAGVFGVCLPVAKFVIIAANKRMTLWSAPPITSREREIAFLQMSCAFIVNSQLQWNMAGAMINLRMPQRSNSLFAIITSKLMDLLFRAFQFRKLLKKLRRDEDSKQCRPSSKRIDIEDAVIHISESPSDISKDIDINEGPPRDFDGMALPQQSVLGSLQKINVNLSVTTLSRRNSDAQMTGHSLTVSSTRAASLNEISSKALDQVISAGNDFSFPEADVEEDIKDPNFAIYYKFFDGRKTVNPDADAPDFIPIDDKTLYGHARLSRIYADWAGLLLGFANIALLVTIPPNSWVTPFGYVPGEELAVRLAMTVALEAATEFAAATIEFYVGGIDWRASFKNFKIAGITWRMFAIVITRLISIIGNFVLCDTGIIVLDDNPAYNPGRRF